jgi:hypothetical protein
MFLVRNVAKRCTSMILGRTLTSVVFAKDIREINAYHGYWIARFHDIGANAQGNLDRSMNWPTECELEFLGSI